MFIKEASEFLNLTYSQFRGYVGLGKIKYEKSGFENYYEYNDDDIYDLKMFFDIIKKYDNKDFDVQISDNLYRKYKYEIDKVYIKNLLETTSIVSLQQYLKYNSILDKKRGFKIEYKCKCGQVSFTNTLKIKSLGIDNIRCNKCISLENYNKRKLKKQKERNIKPKKVIIGTKENPILWSDYIQSKDKYNIGSKKWVKVVCSECKEHCKLQIRSFENRKYGKGLPICSNCIMGYTCNLNEWKLVNRESQLIAQNRPEVKAKMSNIMKNKIKNDIDFRRKITRYSGKLCGYYNDIKFDSSWELSVLYYYGDKIKACEITIPYFYNDKEHLYLPDFDLYLNGKKYLVEVKGQYRESDYIKIETAKKEIEKGLNDYDDIIIIDKDKIKELKDIIIFDSKKKLDMLDSKKIKILKYPKSWK